MYGNGDVPTMDEMRRDPRTADAMAQADAASQAAADQRRTDFLLPGYQDRQDRLLGYAAGAQDRQAPQAQGAKIGRVPAAQDSAFRNNQSGLIAALQRQMSGQDSMAAMQAREANNRAIQQQQALAASARPGQAALAARMASQGAGRLQSSLAQQEAQARLAERLGATQAMGGVLQGARAQDQAMSQFNSAQAFQRALENARMGQQNSQFNVSAGLQQQGMNDSYLLSLLQQELANAGGQQTGAMNYQQMEEQRRQFQASQPSALDKLLGAGGGVMQAYYMGGGGKGK